MPAKKKPENGLGRDRYVSVVSYDEAVASREDGVRLRGGKFSISNTIATIPVKAINQGLSNIISGIADIFEDIPENLGTKFVIEEITLQCEVSGEGQVSLLGNGSRIGG